MSTKCSTLGNEESYKRYDGNWNVEVEDTLDMAQYRVCGSNHEDEIKIHNHHGSSDDS